ncbi:MAG: hypothetical protein ACI9FN_002429 [Saprospiraceae bacterium]|jgi:hypothetical protein
MNKQKKSYFHFLQSNALRVFFLFCIATLIRCLIDGQEATLNSESLLQRIIIWIIALLALAGYQYWKAKKE